MLSEGLNFFFCSSFYLRWWSKLIRDELKWSTLHLIILFTKISLNWRILSLPLLELFSSFSSVYSSLFKLFSLSCLFFDQFEGELLIDYGAIWDFDSSSELSCSLNIFWLMNKLLLLLNLVLWTAYSKTSSRVILVITFKWQFLHLDPQTLHGGAKYLSLLGLITTTLIG